MDKSNASKRSRANGTPSPAPPQPVVDGWPRLESVSDEDYRHVFAIDNSSPKMDPSLIVDTTYDAGRDSEPLLYAVCEADGNIVMADSVLYRNHKLIPPTINDTIERRTVLFPAHPEEYGTEADLDRDISCYLRSYMDVPAFWIELIRYYIKMTWVYDRFSALPYLRFLGGAQGGSGKSRMAEVITRICYKGTFAGVATTAAVLFRLADRYRGSLFLDEADYSKSDLTTDIYKVLNAGYKRDGTVGRCDKDNEDIVYFNVFGPKLLTTRKRFGDESLESRCLTMEVVDNQRLRGDIKCHMPDEIYAESQCLRNKLLLWRLRNYRSITRDESVLRRLGLEPRMVEIAVPLVAVSSGDEEFLYNLAEFCREASKERREQQPQAYIVGAISYLVGQKPKDTLWVKDVAQQASLLKMQQEPDAVKETAKLVHGKDEEQQVFSARRAGAIIRLLGFEPERNRHPAKPERTGYHFDVRADQIAPLVERYNPPILEESTAKPGPLSR